MHFMNVTVHRFWSVSRKTCLIYFPMCSGVTQLFGELRFGQHRILSTTVVQQDDPLGSLLFSLVVLQLLDTIGPIDGLFLHVWYLDDGTLVGTRDAVSSFLNSLINSGPSFGLKLNLKKCEVCWP